MPTLERISTRCLLLGPAGDEFAEVRRALKSASKEAGVRLLSLDEASSIPSGIAETLFPEIRRAALIVAMISHSSPNVFYEVGLAEAMGKPIVFLVDEVKGAPFFDARYSPTLLYKRSAEGLNQLEAKFRNLLVDFMRNPRKFSSGPRLAVPSSLPIVDLERLDPREFENLCFELLTQMGFRRVEWGKELREIDVAATLAKKDPDGFEYHELWLISMGLHASPQVLIEMAMEPDFLLRRLQRPEFIERFRGYFRPDSPITLLLIPFHGQPAPELLEQRLKHIESRYLERRYPFTLRIRVWDKQQLIGLIQQYPQIAYKYFSEEGRAQSKYRKTTEELYTETAELNERLTAANIALREEREKRLRAERDAVWKDVAFKAAHKLGNPIFAVETHLQGLKRRIKAKPDEALAVAEEMSTSIEKAKGIIAQFKSLTRAREISPRPVDLVPLLQSTSRVAVENGVDVKIEASDKLPRCLADPTRLTECFDELFSNALHWCNKQGKRITIFIDSPKRKDLPPDLDQSRKYVRIRFEDNGCGVPVDKKREIFAPFYTTHPHGAGLGLSMVQRIIEGHHGSIRESGEPGAGAVFEIFLPQARPKGTEG